MNSILSFLKGFLALFLILNILVNMVPKEGYQKYIRFFTQMILVFGICYPILKYVGKEDTFLETIQYETFMEGLTETARNQERIEYQANDEYIDAYEKSIALDVTGIAEQYGYNVVSVQVEMTESYEISHIFLEVNEEAEDAIVIGKIVIDEDDKVAVQTEDEKYQELKKSLIQYYQLTEEQLDIVCG